MDKERLTQVGRVLDRLGIEHIPAYSPEARGRSERMFGTLQDRLPKELKLAGITDMESANRFIREVYLPAHNARFAKAAAAGVRQAGICFRSSPRFALIAARTFSAVAGSDVMRTPTASRMALRIAGAVGTRLGSPTPLAPNGPVGS